MLAIGGIEINSCDYLSLKGIQLFQNYGYVHYYVTKSAEKGSYNLSEFLIIASNVFDLSP